MSLKEPSQFEGTDLELPSEGGIRPPEDVPLKEASQAMEKFIEQNQDMIDELQGGGDNQEKQEDE